MSFKPVSLADFNMKPFYDIDKRWMLITAGDKDRMNTMTASWGGVGTLWNKPVVTVYVRPTRYTYDFLEEFDRFSLTFFPDSFRKDLTYLGTHSGRDEDKLANTSLTPCFDYAAPIFHEADTAIVCRTVNTLDLDPARFLCDYAEKNYPDKDYHRLYFGEVVDLLVK